MRTGEPHHVERRKLRVGADEGRRDDGEVLGDVVGDREGGQRTARHQHLLAGLDDLDQLGRVGVEINHVAGFLGRLGAAVHRHRDVGLGECRGVVGAVAGHRHQAALRLVFADQLELGFGRRFGEEIVDPGLGGDGGGGQAVVAGDHHRLDPHAAQLGEAFLDPALDDVFEFDDAEHALAVDDHQRGAAAPCDVVDRALDGEREFAAQFDDVGAHGLGGAFADDPSFRKVDAAHPRLRSEVHEVRAERGDVALAQLETLLGENDDAAPFRRFVGERGELGRVGEFGLADPVGRQEGAGLAVAEGDGAGLVEQQYVDVAGGLDRAPRRGDDVGLQHAAHAGDADGREQAGDGRRDQADEQRDEHGDADRRARLRHVDAELREGQQGGGDDQENEGQRDEQDGQRDFVRRFLALGVLDHGDHAVDESLARIDGDAHHDPVGEDARAAGDGREVAARLADHRRRFAGDGAFVDRGDAFDDFAVGRDEVAGLDENHVALAQIVGGLEVPFGVVARGVQLLGPGFTLQAAQRGGLRLAAAFGERLGEVGEEDGEPQPERDGEDEAGPVLAPAGEAGEEGGLQPEQGGEHAADIDDEHHRVAPLDGRVEFAPGVGKRRHGERRVEEGKGLT